MLIPMLNDQIENARSSVSCLYRDNPIVLGDLDKLMQAWRQEFQSRQGGFDLQGLLAAVEFAALKHASQVRNHADWVPYIIHPMRVALILWEEGKVRAADLIVAALLHDTLEDTETRPEEIGSLFGNHVLCLVQQLTEAPNASLSELLKTMSPVAKVIKLADRTHNLRDLLDHPPKIWKSDAVKQFILKSRALFEELKNIDPKLEEAYLLALDALEQWNKG